MRGIMSTTVELTCCKHPPPARLPLLYAQFNQALLDYSLAAVDFGWWVEAMNIPGLRTTIRKVSLKSDHRGRRGSVDQLQNGLHFKTIPIFSCIGVCARLEWSSLI